MKTNLDFAPLTQAFAGTLRDVARTFPVGSGTLSRYEAWKK
jgi:hypothetical protein